jgi:DNA-binding MarR family transcriptional regulator
MKLTDRQLQVLRYISMFQAVKGWPPTYREIGKAFGITVKRVWDHTNRLIKLGMIEREYHSSRLLHITPQGQEALDLAPNTMAIEAGTMVAYEVVAVRDHNHEARRTS